MRYLILHLAFLVTMVFLVQSEGQRLADLFLITPSLEEFSAFMLGKEVDWPGRGRFLSFLELS